MKRVIGVVCAVLVFGLILIPLENVSAIGGETDPIGNRFDAPKEFLGGGLSDFNKSSSKSEGRDWGFHEHKEVNKDTKSGGLGKEKSGWEICGGKMKDTFWGGICRHD